MTPFEIKTEITALESDVAGLKDQPDRINVIDAIRRSLAEAQQGKVRPAREVLEEMRVKYNIPLSSTALKKLGSMRP